MDSFTKELVSNASGQLFPDNTLSFFTNFLPEQLNLEGQWEVAMSEFGVLMKEKDLMNPNLPTTLFVSIR